MRPSIKLYKINTALHEALILCITIFLTKDFDVIKKAAIYEYSRRCVTPISVARRHGMFWGHPQCKPNKRGRVVGSNVFTNSTELCRQVFRPFAFHILLCPNLVMVFTSGHKELQLPEYELWVLSLILKSFIVSRFLQKLKWAPNAESEISLESSVCFIFSHGPGLAIWILVCLDFAFHLLSSVISFSWPPLYLTFAHVQTISTYSLWGLLPSGTYVPLSRCLHFSHDLQLV